MLKLFLLCEICLLCILVSAKKRFCPLRFLFESGFYSIRYMLDNDRSVGEVVRDTANGAGGLRFDYRARKMRHSVANRSPPLRGFCVVQPLNRGDEPRHSLHASAQYREYNEDLTFLCWIMMGCWHCRCELKFEFLNNTRTISNCYAAFTEL